MGCGKRKTAATLMGLFVFLEMLYISIIAGGVELIGHAKVLDWRGDLRFGGLTGFWVGWIWRTGEESNGFSWHAERNAGILRCAQNDKCFYGDGSL
jgi:hypothetical protein